MSNTGLSLRLPAEASERLRRIAAAEHRSVAAYLALLVERDLAARDEAERVVRVHVAPELVGQPKGRVSREADESDARHARRQATLGRLFDGA